MQENQLHLGNLHPREPLNELVDGGTAKQFFEKGFKGSHRHSGPLKTEAPPSRSFRHSTAGQSFQSMTSPRLLCRLVLRRITAPGATLSSRGGRCCATAAGVPGRW